MKRSFVDTALGQVHYVDSLESEKEAVFLLHQTPRSSDEFAEVLPLLAGQFRVVAVDNPGYGASDPPPSAPSIADYVSVLTALQDHLALSRSHLVGHHTGAILAVEMAAAFPERVGKSVLSGPVYMDAEMRAELSKIFIQWKVQPDGSHLQEKWNRFRKWLKDPMLAHRSIRDLLVAGETSEYGHWACAEYKMEDRLPHVRCPVLLLYGADDPFCGPKATRPFFDILPDVRETKIDGGIFVPTENPEGFASAVRDFL